MSDPLREALADLLDWVENTEGEGRLRRTEAVAKARKALAAAPEPSYQWRICGRRKFLGQWEEWDGPVRHSKPEQQQVRGLRKRNPEVWVERRAAIISPWERVEVEDGEG